MSKVVIQGNASGTGNFTIAAPNSDTNRTLTLPDEAGEVLVTDGTTLVVDQTNDRVGIGTASPIHPLHVSTTSGTIARFAATTNTAAFEINSSDANSIALKAMATDGLILSTNNTERMRIDSAGNVMVGKTATGATAAGVQLYPNGEATAVTTSNTSGTGPLFYLVNSGSTVTNGYRFVTFRATSSFAEVGKITTNGTSSTSYNTTSDYRLKEDWQPMSGSVDRVKALKPVNFAWKIDGSRVDGFLAHEAQTVVPEAVTGTKDEMHTEEYEVTPAVLDDDGNVVTEAVMGTREVPEYQGIDQSKLVPLLTAALQEAITKIETLEARVTALENA